MKRPKMDGSNIGDITTYQAGVVQAAVHRNLQKRCDEILKPFGITKTQWLIIGTVLDAGNKGVRISELADEVGTTLPYLTNTINLLQTKGILVRRTDAGDSRSKYVTVDRKYIPMTKKIENAMRVGLRETVYSQVSVRDFHTYMRVLYELYNSKEQR